MLPPFINFAVYKQNKNYYYSLKLYIERSAIVVAYFFRLSLYMFASVIFKTMNLSNCCYRVGQGRIATGVYR